VNSIRVSDRGLSGFTTRQNSIVYIRVSQAPSGACPNNETFLNVDSGGSILFQSRDPAVLNIILGWLGTWSRTTAPPSANSGTP